MRTTFILGAVSSLFLMTILSCSGDDSSSPTPPPPPPVPQFGQAEYCGHPSSYNISIALDGTSIVPGPIVAFEPAKFQQGPTPCGSTVEVERPRVFSPCISPDGKSFVAEWSDSSTEHLEIWTRTSGTNWSFDTRIATFVEADSTSFGSPKFAASGTEIILTLARNSFIDPGKVIVRWVKTGGNWVGPDTLRSPGGDPIGYQYWEPTLSPDGKYLFTNARGSGWTYQIVQFRKDTAGAWVFLGEISSAFNIPDVEEIYGPFIAYDYSYIYFGGYDRDHTEPSGIYRAAIIFE